MLNSLYKCCSWLLWPFHCEDLAKKRKAMVLYVHMSNCESSAHRSGIQIRHGDLPQRSHAIYCTKRQTSTIISDEGQILLELNEYLQSTLLHGKFAYHTLPDNKFICLPDDKFFSSNHTLKNWSIIENSFDKLKPMQISFVTDFEKSICQRWTTGKSGDLHRKKPYRRGSCLVDGKQCQARIL